ncbi:MAG: isoaspartyl peptidase/L-asparaginase [Gammaproteobacteria bacterium]
MFNAGTGSSLQSDVFSRMSSAIMNTANNIFSGVINIERVKNPIEVAWL